MHKNLETYDYLIVGGGIFGIYSAIYLSQKNKKVCLIEKEKELLKKASIVNQARLHGGYHYPRSIATARIADDHKERFTRDHASFINFKFNKYYAIDKYSSFTNSQQFERFCNYLNIKAKKVKKHELFDLSQQGLGDWILVDGKWKPYKKEKKKKDLKKFFF